MSTDSVPLKQCSRKEQCISPLGSWQPSTTEYFRKASKEKSGLTSRCKSCLHQGDAKYREENPDHAKDWYAAQKLNNPEYFKEQYEKNKDKVIARTLKWQKDFPEKANAKSRRSYQLHRDERLAYFKEYNRNYPEITKATRKKYKDSHKEQVAAYNAEYDRNHPERARVKATRRRVRIMGNGGKHTRADLLRIFDEQNGRCAYCGITIYWSIPYDVHIDHIQPLSKGGTNWSDNLACACSDCNLSKADKTLPEWLATRGW